MKNYKNTFSVAEESIKEINQLMHNKSDSKSAYEHSIQIIQSNIDAEKEWMRKVTENLMKFGQELHDAMTALNNVQFVAPTFKSGGVVEEKSKEIFGFHCMIDEYGKIESVPLNNYSKPKTRLELIDFYASAFGKDSAHKLSNSQKATVFDHVALDMEKIHENEIQWQLGRVSTLQEEVKEVQQDVDVLVTLNLEIREENVMLKKANKECLARMEQMGCAIDRYQRENDNLKRLSENKPYPAKPEYRSNLELAAIAIICLLISLSFVYFLFKP